MSFSIWVTTLIKVKPETIRETCWVQFRWLFLGIGFDWGTDNWRIER